MIPHIPVHIHIRQRAQRIPLQEAAQRRSVDPRAVIVEAQGRFVISAGKENRIARWGAEGAGAGGGNRLQQPRAAPGVIGVALGELAGCIRECQDGAERIRVEIRDGTAPPHAEDFINPRAGDVGGGDGSGRIQFGQALVAGDVKELTCEIARPDPSF